jgi:hypothetical protein
VPGHRRTGRVWGRGCITAREIRWLLRRKGQRSRDDRRDKSEWADYWRSMLAKGWL